MTETGAPVLQGLPVTMLADAAADRLVYAMEHLNDIRYQLGMSLVDPTGWPALREEIADDLSVALEQLTALFGVTVPATPRWMGQPEDDEDPAVLRELAAERRTYRRVTDAFTRGASGTEIAWEIAEEEMATGTECR